MMETNVKITQKQFKHIRPLLVYIQEHGGGAIIAQPPDFASGLMRMRTVTEQEAIAMFAIANPESAPPPPAAPDAALLAAAKELLNACTKAPVQSPATITAMSNLNVAIIANEMPEAAKIFRAAIAQAETATGD